MPAILSIDPPPEPIQAIPTPCPDRTISGRAVSHDAAPVLRSDLERAGPAAEGLDLRQLLLPARGTADHPLDGGAAPGARAVGDGARRQRPLLCDRGGEPARPPRHSVAGPSFASTLGVQPWRG